MNVLVCLTITCGVLLMVISLQSPQTFQLRFPQPRIRRIHIPIDVWPDAVDDVASAIRAGLSLPQAVCELTQSSSPELAKEFDEVAREYISTGNFVQALSGLYVRNPEPIVQKFVNAITIAYEVGGSDLGVMLRTLAEVIRDDVKLRGEVQARQSWTVNGARLAVGAPWVTVLLLSSRSDAARVYQSASGMRILALCAVISVLAYVVMQRIGRLPAGSF